jgi:hypothetical protein
VICASQATRGAYESGWTDSAPASATYTINLPPPPAATLTAPANAAVNQPSAPALTWAAAAGATSYAVYLGSGTPTLAGSGTSTMTVATAATDAGGVAGDFSLAVTASSGGLVHGATATLLLQDFTASLSQAQQVVGCSGGTLTYELTAAGANGFAGPISFAFHGFYEFDKVTPTTLGPVVVTGSGNTQTVAVTIPSTQPYCYQQGFYGDFAAMSGGVRHEVWGEIDENINGTPGVTLTVGPSAQTVAGAGMVVYSVVASSGFGYDGPVDFSVAGLPAGVSGVFIPSSHFDTVVGGSPAVATLALTVGAGAQAGTYTFTVTVTGTGGISDSKTATLTVGQNTVQRVTVTTWPAGLSVTVDNQACTATTTTSCSSPGWKSKNSFG